MSESDRRYSPYNYTRNNPIRFTDHDGMFWEDENLDNTTNDWIPRIIRGQLTLVAEKGDNAQTLAKFLSVDQKTANRLFKSKNKNGNITLTDDISGVKAINSLINDTKNNPDNYSESWYARLTTDLNYNCYGCALSISNGKTPSLKAMVSESDFKTAINSDDFTNITGQQSLYKFGETVVSFGEKSWDLSNGVFQTIDHAATYLGTSQSGDQYTWSKDGYFVTPKIETINQLRFDYGSSIIKYYNRK